MPIEIYALAVAIAALVVAMVGLYYATHTKRLYQEVPAPHEHKWRIIRTDERMNAWTNARVGYVYTLQCEGCGDVKAKDVKLVGNS